MALTWPDKDPNAVLDYSLDWSAWLGADTIASSSWTLGSTLVEDSKSFTDTTTTIWLSGGSDSDVVNVVNRITTAGGRTDDRTVTLTIAER